MHSKLKSYLGSAKPMALLVVPSRFKQSDGYGGLCVDFVRNSGTTRPQFPVRRSGDEHGQSHSGCISV